MNRTIERSTAAVESAVRETSLLPERERAQAAAEAEWPGSSADRQVRSRRELALWPFNAVNIDAVCLRAKWQRRRLSHTPYHPISLTGMSRSAKNTTTSTTTEYSEATLCKMHTYVYVGMDMFLKLGVLHLDENFMGHIHAPFIR